MKNKKHLSLAISLLFILTMIFFASRLEPKKETVIILKEQDMYPDLTQSNEGTVIIDFRAVDEDVNVGGILPTKILLFRSRKVSGLVIYYLYHEKKIRGGLPKLTTPEVNLLDGMLHKIVYTFKKDDKQKFFFDGNKISESDYIPQIPITGFAVKQTENEINIDKGNINFEVYDRVLTEEEVRAKLR